MILGDPTTPWITRNLLWTSKGAERRRGTG